MTELIFANYNYRAHFTNRNTRKLIVTFDHFEWNKSDFLAPHTSVYGIEKWNHLHIGSRQNDWFTSDGLSDLQQACLKAISSHSEVIHYGSSMAAYAAILFGQVFQPSRIIAISPRFELDHRKPPFDKRGLEYTDKLKLIKGRAIKDIASRFVDTTIIYDPFMPEDSAHARLYRNTFPEWNFIQMPFGGHPAYRGLKHTGQIVPLVETLLVGDHSPKNIHQHYDQYKRFSPNYWYNLGMRSKSEQLVSHAQKFVANHKYSTSGWADALKDRLCDIREIRLASKKCDKSKPTPEDIKEALRPLDKRYHDGTMIVDIILDIARQLESIGADEYALMQYKIALCKWPSNDELPSLISRVEKRIALYNV